MEDSEFKQMFHGELKPDPVFELYVKAWMRYHKAADEVDGHLPPGSPEQARLGAIAVRAGKYAMEQVLPGEPDKEDRRWQEAKHEALRRLGMK